MVRGKTANHNHRGLMTNTSSANNSARLNDVTQKDS
jgi:hypothetical protein